MGMCWSTIGQFFSLSLITVPEALQKLTSLSFFFVSKVVNWRANAHWSVLYSIHVLIIMKLQENK